MKRELLLLLLSLSFYSESGLFAQSKYRFKTYYEIKEHLVESPVIFLGERNHSDFPSMFEKIEIIKYLHEELGYNVLFFESSIYEMYKANQMLIQGEDMEKLVYEGVHEYWHDTEPLDALIDYLSLCRERGDTLYLSGFDNQLCSSSQVCFQLIDDLVEFTSVNNITVDDRVIPLIRRTLEFVSGEVGIDEFTYKKEEYTPLTELAKELEKLQTNEADFWRRCIISLNAQVFDLYLSYDNPPIIPISNIRDSLMAQNFLSLYKQDTDEKVIGWAATIHIAHNIHELSLNDQVGFFDWIKPMGAYLKDSLKDDYLTVGISDIALLQKELNPIEYAELPKNRRQLIDFRDTVDIIGKSCLIDAHVGGYYPFGKWNEVVDVAISFNSVGRTIVSGSISDFETKEPIPFAHIKISNSSKGTVSNQDGEFEIILENDDLENEIIVSSIGYMPYHLKEFEEGIHITLMKSDVILNEITVKDDLEDPKLLLKKVIRNHLQKSTKTPVSFNCYYYAVENSEKYGKIENEAAVKIYRKQGYEVEQLSTIVNKRLISKTAMYFPWPTHTFMEADFLPGYKLLNRAFFKKVRVDSLHTEYHKNDSLTHIYYSCKKKERHINGELIFDTNSLEIKRHLQRKHHSEIIDGNIPWVYTIDYMKYKGAVYPKIARQEYVSSRFSEDKRKGSAVFMINEINTVDPENIEPPIIIEMKDAPYDKAFWEEYNKIPKTNDVEIKK